MFEWKSEFNGKLTTNVWILIPFVFAISKSIVEYEKVNVNTYSLHIFPWFAIVIHTSAAKIKKHDNNGSSL